MASGSRSWRKGWSAEWGDWIWDEDRLKETDVVLHEAAQRGVKLIIPIINQDFGSEDTNWVGSIADLMRYVCVDWRSVSSCCS